LKIWIANQKNHSKRQFAAFQGGLIMRINYMDYEFYMTKALEQAQQALEAGEFPVGCVLVCQDKILETGARRRSIGSKRNEIDHAEIVALRRLSDLGDSIDHSQITAFCTLEPCLMCFSALILAGIGKIVYAYEDIMGGGAGCELSRLRPLYRDSSLIVVPGVLRTESLKLFKDFFADPANDYLKQSLLAEYTLGA
jgi:tRNA(adenine34) deaminase